MKVKNMEYNGRKVANQFVITGDNKIIFQSHDSVICIIDEEKKELTIGRDWDYSRTTSKYFYHFLKVQLGVDWKKKEIDTIIGGHLIPGNKLKLKITYDYNLQ